MKKLFLLSLFTSVFLNSQTPGTQDMSFGTNGSTEFVLSQSPFKGFQGYGINVLPNGSFFVGGVSNWGCSADQYYTGVLTKFSQNGILDTSFNQTGYIDNIGIVQKINPSNDGNYFSVSQYSTLVKIDINGNRINSWGNNGAILMPDSYDIRDWKQAANGDIIVAAVKRDYANKYYSAILKYDQNGILQTSFGTNGMIDLSANVNWLFTNVNIDNNGNFLFTGKKRTSPVYDDAQIVVLKTDTNGVPFANFGTNGIYTITNFSSYYNNNSFTFITPDNGLVISTAGSSNRYLIVKVSPDATLPASFNSGFKYTSSVIDPINTFYINDSFYVFGQFNGSSFVIGKINSNGNVDTTYNTNGYINITRLPGNHNATRAILQDNKIIIAETMDNFYCAQANWKLVMRRFSFDASSTLSTNENPVTKDINIYPNPADKEIFAEGFTKEIEIATIDGRKIDTKISSNEDKLSIDIRHLTKGTYLIKGKTPDGKFISRKFIKK